MRTAGFSSERALRGQRCADEAATHQFLRASAMRSTPARSGDSVLHESAGPTPSIDALDALDLAGDELGVRRFLSGISAVRAEAVNASKAHGPLDAKTAGSGAYGRRTHLDHDDACAGERGGEVRGWTRRRRGERARGGATARASGGAQRGRGSAQEAAESERRSRDREQKQSARACCSSPLRVRCDLLERSLVLCDVLRATGASRRPTRLCGVYAWRQLRCDSQPAQSHLKTIGSRPERSEDGRDEDRDSGPADPASRIVLDDIRSCSEGRVRPAREGPRRAARKSTAASRQQINSLLRVPTRRRCFPSPF